VRLDLQSKAVAVKARTIAYRRTTCLYIRDTGPTRSSRAGPTCSATSCSPTMPCSSNRGVPFHARRGGRHHAFRRPGDRAAGSTLSRESWSPDRGLLQVAVSFRRACRLRIEPEFDPCRLSVALQIELAAHGGRERRLRRNHLDVFRPHDQLANPDLAGPPGEVPGSVRYEAALAELRAEGLERDRPGRSGALERRIEIQGDRRCSLSGQLRGKP